MCVCMCVSDRGRECLSVGESVCVGGGCSVWLSLFFVSAEAQSLSRSCSLFGRVCQSVCV